MQKVGPKFIKFGPIHLGPNCGLIHLGLKLWPENLVQLNYVDHDYLCLTLISKKIFWER